MPLVTVGVPVRNGAPHIRAALESVLRQDYDRLDILVSDNASTDATPEIVRDLMATDPRIRYVRHDPPVTAFDNFMYVLAEARGEYFMWAAHDDSRSPDFVSGLLGPLRADPAAVLCFGDLWIAERPAETGVPRPYDFDTGGLGRLARVRKAASMQCYHIYGLWRTGPLRAIRLDPPVWWADLPLMVAAAWCGRFRYVGGPRFSYFEIPKTNVERTAYQDYRSDFNYPSAVLDLTRASYQACAGVGGVMAGCLAAGFVLLRQIRRVPGYLWRRWRGRGRHARGAQ